MSALEPQVDQLASVVIAHDSIDSVKSFFEEYAGPFAATEFFEADAANAVGLPK